MAILRVINPKAKLHVDMPVSVDVLKAPALVFFIKTFIKGLERNKDFITRNAYTVRFLK